MNPLLSAITRYFRRPHRASGGTRTAHRKARRQRRSLCAHVFPGNSLASGSFCPHRRVAVRADAPFRDTWAGTRRIALDQPLP
jgi:hypothetical protein